MNSPFLQTRGLLRYIGLFMSGICHQLPEHSIHLAGVQAPLCARCTGTYLGALGGLCNFWLRGRLHAGRLPPARVVAMQGLFVAFWAIDGLNSYIQFLPGVSGLYPPSNFVRLTAGMLNGLALSLLILPVFNLTFWREPRLQRVVRSLRELGSILVQLIGVELLLQAHIDALLYPLLVLESLSVLLLLTIVNSMIVIILLRRENHAQHWKEGLLPFSGGLLLSILEVVGIALIRYRLGTVVPALIRTG